MAEHTGVITFKGKPMTLVGDKVNVGDKAPSFTATANDLSDIGLDAYKGKVAVISSVPSLDTGVCDIQTKKFNEHAGQLGDDVAVLTISMDLPFAQKRWCGASGVENVVTISDYKHRSFGANYGLYIKELGLLTRAVIVIDQNGTVKDARIVGEVTHEPDYDATLQVVRGLL